MRLRRLIRLIWLAVLVTPSALFSDDLAIFGAVPLSVEPNILIIFDTSGSMGEELRSTEVVIGDYDYTINYKQKFDDYSNYMKYDPEYVYYEVGSRYSELLSIGSNRQLDYDELSDTCNGDIDIDKFNKLGKILGVKIGTRGRSRGICSNSNDVPPVNIYTGNYLNYLKLIGATGGEVDATKLLVAKNTISDLIRSTVGVRFGVMVFNYYYDWFWGGVSTGGRIVAPIANRDDDSAKNNLIDEVNKQVANGSTPLAESLAEAGLYFAGKKSFANAGSNGVAGLMYSGSNQYISPIQWRCQRNFVIVMTDGESTDDLDKILYDKEYMWGLEIGDFDGNGDDPGHYDSGGSDYLDDVAKFLYDTDLVRDVAGSFLTTDNAGVSFDQARFWKQNIQTYTIGFDINNSLLSRTADVNHGHAHYYTTKDGISLTEIFSNIIGDISTTNAQFVAPVVPLSRSNKTYADNAIYICVFKPDASGFWLGNIKKFALDDDGVIFDRNGELAVDPVLSTHDIKDDASSAWPASVKDGLIVDKGGIGQQLWDEPTSRKFYTNLTSSKDLTNMYKDTTNTVVNPDLKPGYFLGTGSTDTASRDDLINFACGQGKYASDSTKRSWMLGSIIHSRPAIYSAKDNENVILVGANDGFLHCFIDDDKGTTDMEANNKKPIADDTVKEAWAFMPWELAGNLKKLPPVGATKVSGDDEPDYFVDGSPLVYSIGSSHYVVFGLRRGGSGYYCLNITDCANPKFAWKVPLDILGSSVLLGQSWVEPHVVTIKRADGSSAQLVLLAGGYDADNEDMTAPANADSKGCSVFAVDAFDGELDSDIKLFNTDAAKPVIKHCIVDLAVYDFDSDNFDDTIYAPTLGGELHCLNDRDRDGKWISNLVFDAGDAKQKFFNAPAVVQMTWGDCLYIGSGDREHPSDTTVVNKFYCISNNFSGNISVPYYNVTTPIEAQSGASKPTSNQLAASGWYLNLTFSGEKCLSSPTVYDGNVYFTTFTPTTLDNSSSDKCSSGVGPGVARLYVVNYKTGSAVRDFDGHLGNDRSVVIGAGLPTDPVVVATKNGTKVMVASQKTVLTFEAGVKQTLVPYYWKQL